MSYAVISEPFETDDGSYVMLVGTCDGVTTKSFVNLEEAAKELQTVKNMIAMNAGEVAMVLVSDAGGQKKTRAAFMESYNKMHLQKYGSRVKAAWRAFWKQGK